MKVLVATEQRFYRAGGRIVTAGPRGFSFWSQYLGVFDEVGVLARVGDGPASGDSLEEVTGPGVTVHAAPAYLGPGGYMRARPGLLRAATEAAGLRCAVIVRAPSPLGALLLGRLRGGFRRAFGLEVVGDPLEVFARGSVRHPLRIVFRAWFSRQLRRQCLEAAAIAYVTRASLPARYPPRTAPPPPFVTSCPSSDLPVSALVDRAREPEAFRPPFRLVTVASLEQPYKGVDVLLRAIAACRGRGAPVSLSVVGEGRERPGLERLARRLSLSEHVTFTGQLSPPEVVARLDESDLFVLASRTEGLPQAMIEAMARGLPSLGSDVGGIPELLDADDRFPAGSVTALAETLTRALADPGRLATMSTRSLATAREHTTDVQGPRRRAFHGAVRDATVEAQRGLDG